MITIYKAQRMFLKHPSTHYFIAVTKYYKFKCVGNWAESVLQDIPEKCFCPLSIVYLTVPIILWIKLIVRARANWVVVNETFTVTVGITAPAPDLLLESRVPPCYTLHETNKWHDKFSHNSHCQQMLFPP